MSEPLEIYFNGACPVCSREIGAYRRLAEHRGVAARWIDVAAQPDALAGDGIGSDAALRRLHVRTSSGLEAGVPAFVALWTRLPGWAAFARTAAHPLVRPLAGFLYERILAPTLYAWHKLRHRDGSRGV